MDVCLLVLNLEVSQYGLVFFFQISACACVPFLPLRLAAVLLISRDACSDSIAKRFRVCFCGVSHNYRAIRCKMGYRTDVSV